MVNYNKKMVFDYINGNEINNYTIDELENDYRFMIEVIKNTKDKKMYNLCSEDVKNNYEFVKFLIFTFKDEIDFVNNVVKNYLDTIDEDDINYKELIVLMGDLNKKVCEQSYFYYSMKTLLLYEEEKQKIKMIFKYETDDYWKKQYGLGFVFILEEYSGSGVLLDFFAKKFVQEIFYKRKYTFEELIHKNTKNKNDIYKNGVNNYLINIIKKHDINLANYICCHIDILDCLRYDLELVNRNWDNYIDFLNERRFEIIYQEVIKCLEENSDIKFCYYDVMSYIFKKLHLEYYYEKYELGMNMDLINDSTFNLGTLEFNFQEIKCIRDITKLVNELFKEDVIKKNNYDRVKKYNCRVLKVNFEQK